VPPRHFARSKLDDADERVLGLDQNLFADWHIVPLAEKKKESSVSKL
jgi:hypothetical protein